MAIRVIQAGDIQCDGCGAHIARIEASREVYEVLMNEEKYVKVFCHCTPNTPSQKK